MNTINLMLSLGLMWKGMLAIFVVIIVVFLVVNLLLRVTGNKSEDSEQ